MASIIILITCYHIQPVVLYVVNIHDKYIRAPVGVIGADCRQTCIPPPSSSVCALSTVPTPLFRLQNLQRFYYYYSNRVLTVLLYRTAHPTYQGIYDAAFFGTHVHVNMLGYSIGSFVPCGWLVESQLCAMCPSIDSVTCRII